MSALKHASWPLADLQREEKASAKPFHIFLDNPTMRAEYLEYPAGHVDTQQPHDWDELYYIISGAAQFTASGETYTVAKGDNIFVAAHQPHRFHDITDTLEVIVFFSKAEPHS